MDGFLIFIGLIAMLTGVISLIKPLQFLRITTRKMGALVLVFGFVLLIIGGSLVPAEEKTVAEREKTVVEESVPVDTVVEEPEPVEDIATMGEKNALKTALNYLSFTAFSYNGLVEQLSYEGYTQEEAVYGADNCGADWNEQAALKAEAYLDMTSFSREGLISQLEYEGFTREQAEYGTQAVGY